MSGTRVGPYELIEPLGQGGFELLAGRPPFEAESETMLEEQVASSPAPDHGLDITWEYL